MLLQKFMDFEPDSQSLSCRQVAAILYLCFPLYFPVKLSECTDFGMVCVKHTVPVYPLPLLRSFCGLCFSKTNIIVCSGQHSRLHIDLAARFIDFQLISVDTLVVAM